MTDNDVHGRLIAATQKLAAESGIEEVSLRVASAAVGRSTTVVFQHFGSKEGLLLASMEDAFAQDRHWHETLLASLEAMPRGADALAGVLSHYVTSRVGWLPAQLWLEGCYKSREFAKLTPLLQQWHALREQFWRDLLAGSAHADLASPLAAYATAEEPFAATMSGEVRYDLLLGETARSLFAGAARDPEGSLTEWREQRVQPFDRADKGALESTMRRLLDQAVRVIVKRGAAGLNLRRVATDADVAPSQIVYHFGDFAAFRRQAIIEALRQGMPAALDPDNRAVEAEASRWSQALRDMIQPATDRSRAGFYVNYARILGQACLAAKSDASLRTLVADLRAIEGIGIFRMSQASWPADLRLSRRAAAPFALWIKGHAIVAEAICRTAGEEADELEIVSVARLIAPTRG